MLRLENVSFAYSEAPALRDVSFTTGPGQLIALAGQNGSGKSTLLKAAARVISPREGAVYFDERSLRDWGYVIGSWRQASTGIRAGFWFTPYRFWAEPRDGLGSVTCVDFP